MKYIFDTASLLKTIKKKQSSKEIKSNKQAGAFNLKL